MLDKDYSLIDLHYNLLNILFEEEKAKKIAEFKKLKKEIWMSYKN
jgi:hypothetical protein